MSIMLLNQRDRVLALSGILVFLALILFGFSLAQKRPIWGDEAHTLGSIQISNNGLHETNYLDILLGKIDYESNNAPLFYIIQKAIVMGLFDYKMRSLFYHDYNDPEDYHLRIVARIDSVTFGALALALIYFYFSKFYSFWAGLYGIFLAMSSQIFLPFWAEGRPYMQWMSLTTFEILLFLHLMRNGYHPRIWNLLILIHIFLVCTASLSLPYIMVISFALWLFVHRKWQDYIGMAIIPLLLAGYFAYQLARVGYASGFYFVEGYKDLILAHFQKEQLLISIVFLALAAYINRKDKDRILSLMKESRGYILTIIGFLMAMVALLVFMKIHKESTTMTKVMNRYFVNLTPASIITGTYFSLALVKLFDDKKLIKWLVLFGIAMVSISRFYITHRYRLAGVFPG